MDDPQDPFKWIDDPFKPKPIDYVFRFARRWPFTTLLIIAIILASLPYGCGVATGVLL